MQELINMIWESLRKLLQPLVDAAQRLVTAFARLIRRIPDKKVLAVSGRTTSQLRRVQRRLTRRVAL